MFVSVGVPGIPTKLAQATGTFREKMVLAETLLAEGSLERSDVQALVDHACTEMIGCLQEHVGATPFDGGIAAYIAAELSPWFQSSDFVNRCVTKPQGYSGDYFTIEQLYRNEPSGRGQLGRLLDRWALQVQAAQAVRNRRQILTGMLRETLAVWNEPGPMPVTSLASGPAREVFDLFGQVAPDQLHVTCVDIDQDALQFVADQAEVSGTSQYLTLARENVVWLSDGRSQITIPPQRFIYSMGLIDYLEDRYVVKLLDWVFDHLLPSGTAVIGCFGRGNPDQAWMEYLLDWVLIYRSPDEMRALFGQSKFGAANVTVQTDVTGIQLLGVVQKG